MRATILFALAWILAGPGGVGAQQPVEVERLTDNLQLIRPSALPRTVMLALTGSDGALVVDFENPDLETFRADDAVAASIRDALERAGAWPVRYLINTHWHPDHVGGNERLGADALIVAQAETRRLLSIRQTPWWLPQGIGPMPAAGLPAVTFDDRMTLHLNGEVIELLNFGPAHTEGDAVVWFRNAGYAHVGDLFHGFENLAPGDDMEGLARTYAALLETLPTGTRLVSGHGPIEDLSQLERQHRMLVATLAWMKAELEAGATLERLQEQPLPAPWNEEFTGSDGMRKQWLGAIHRSLEERSPSDEEQLLALHRRSMDAHLESDVDKLLAAEGADAVVGSRGEISRPSIEERRALFGDYFGVTHFEVYRDMVPPAVKVSKDGSLGWVIVQVEASGVQDGASGALHEIKFQSNWIELYEKRDGEWLRVGNVSNFAPF